MSMCKICLHNPCATRCPNSFEKPPVREIIKPSYIGMNENKGIVVEKEEAVDFALDRLGLKISDKDLFDKLKDEFEEWFFSGDWRKKEAEEACA